jgi:hypothetical protein
MRCQGFPPTLISAPNHEWRTSCRVCHLSSSCSSAVRDGLAPHARRKHLSISARMNRKTNSAQQRNDAAPGRSVKPGGTR